MADTPLDATADPPAGDAVPTEAAPSPKVDNAEVAKDLKAQIATAKTHRRTFHSAWKTNVDLRLGQTGTLLTGGTGLDGDQQSVLNPDWALTKTKTANLYSQVPSVQATHHNVQYAKAIPPFAKALNYEVSEKRANLGAAMEEATNDVVNAAGVGVIVVNYLARFEDVEMPTVTTVQGPAGPVPTAGIPSDQLQAMGVPTQRVPRVVSYKFTTDRIAPWRFLWPKPFTGSCFDHADWLGYSGALRWAEAKSAFHLTDAQKEDVCGAGSDPAEDRIRGTTDQHMEDETDLVSFETVHYWRHRVDPDETSFQAIWELVFVAGLDDPVIHEPWHAQKYDPQTRSYVGAVRFPERVLTLTYISDHPIPPSDSQAGRPQVQDLQKSRLQMFTNRDRSLPLRWFNTNLVDLDIQTQLLAGTWQGLIPVNGSGERILGEVARASFPAENRTFDQQTTLDLQETWGLGSNQMGTRSAGRQTKGEAELTQGNFSTNIGREKARVALFLLGICEVLAGWMALYSDFPMLSDEERTEMQQAWDSQRILADLVLSIRPDSMITLDPEQRLERLERIINFTVKSGYVNPAPLLAEYLELGGLDPSTIMIQPKPHEDKPKVSFSFSGKDDLTSPAVMAILIHNQEAPSPDDVTAAHKLLAAVQVVPPPDQPPPGPPGAMPPGAALPGVPPPPAGDAHPDWHTPSKIVDRSRDASA